MIEATPMDNRGKDHHHLVTIQEVEEMEERIKEMPRLLNKFAGKESCCIFRVPQSLVEINKKAYQPHIVSIGPYHHGKEHLKMIEEHKRRFLMELLARTPPNGTRLDGYLKAVASMEGNIRNCYSEFIDFSSYDLIKMMVLDGLFMIELFAKAGEVAPSEPDDPIFKLAWLFPFLTRDLLRLENQIPFFVLQILFDIWRVTRKGSESSSDPSLAKLVLEFFNHMLDRPDKVLKRYDNLEGKHLLDFFRLSFIPPPPPQAKAAAAAAAAANPISRRKRGKMVPLLQMIQSSKKLHAAGIKFKTRPAESFLDIRFRKGVLEMPQITIDAFIASFFFNSVAFEQCYSHCSKHMTAYTTFMGCLVKTPSDAGFLCEHKILDNYFGTEEEIAGFFNDLGKDVPFDIHSNYLSEVFREVNGYYRNGWHVRWAGFKDTYFNTPWSFMSAVAAVVLLLLTMIQAFIAVYAYLRPPAGPAPTP